MRRSFLKQGKKNDGLFLKNRRLLAEVVGFEPTKCWSQSPVPYRLAIPQFESLIIIARAFVLVNIFFENVSDFGFFDANDRQKILNCPQQNAFFAKRLNFFAGYAMITYV